MNRRSFLAVLGGAAAGVALEQVSGLWAPAKTFFLPPAGGWPRDDAIAWDQVRALGWPGHPVPSGFFQKGDIITINGHYVRNPLTGDEMRPHLQTYVVLQDADLSDPTVSLGLQYADIHPDPRVLNAMNKASGRKGFRDYRSAAPDPRVFERAMRGAMGRSSRRQAWL